jgi:hypothetical protein
VLLLRHAVAHLAAPLLTLLEALARGARLERSAHAGEAGEGGLMLAMV